MLETLSALALLGAWPAQAADGGSSCVPDSARVLALPVDKFDQDLQGGWRAVEQKDGCRRAAADLIAQYRQAHEGQLKFGDLQELIWHEGQMRAAAGQNERAIPLMLASVHPDDRADFADYALGTVAFLQGDLAALKAARKRLAKVPQPEWFKKEAEEMRAQTGEAPSWPVNLNVLDMLIGCWGRPYAVAYQGCQPAQKKKN